MIYINDKIRIGRADDLNLQLEFLTKGKSKKTKEEVVYWENRGFYSSLENALRAVLKYKLIDIAEETTDIKNVIHKIESAAAEITDAIDKYQEGIKI